MSKKNIITEHHVYNLLERYLIFPYLGEVQLHFAIICSAIHDMPNGEMLIELKNRPAKSRTQSIGYHAYTFLFGERGESMMEMIGIPVIVARDAILKIGKPSDSLGLKFTAIEDDSELDFI